MHVQVLFDVRGKVHALFHAADETNAAARWSSALPAGSARLCSRCRPSSHGSRRASCMVPLRSRCKRKARG